MHQEWWRENCKNSLIEKCMNRLEVYIDQDLVPKTPFTSNLLDSFKHVDKEFIPINPKPGIFEKHRIKNILTAINSL
jgi:hypothetical protein